MKGKSWAFPNSSPHGQLLVEEEEEEEEEIIGKSTFLVSTFHSLAACLAFTLPALRSSILNRILASARDEPQLLIS
jgi:hypothetical protein